MVEIMIRLFNHAFYECHGISHVLTHRRQNELQVYELVHVQPYIGIIGICAYEGALRSC